MVVTPWIIVPDAAALLEFLADVFGAEELGRVPGPDGRIGHAETRIGDAVIATFDALPGWPATPAYLRVHVDDVAGVVERATALGAVVATPPTHLVFGDVVTRLRDPWDNLWWVHQTVEQLEVTDLVGRMAEPEARTTMAAFEESLDVEMRRRASGARGPS